MSFSASILRLKDMLTFPFRKPGTEPLLGS